ncbi:MAG: hypothetical protein Ct9H300mP1_34770 [Planctomycetaceae bacterium]|nr:MAG: hypothetical protein Ct9H300mP1_34770 [Planctomycetaceae bacterium]
MGRQADPHYHGSAESRIDAAGKSSGDPGSCRPTKGPRLLSTSSTAPTPPGCKRRLTRTPRVSLKPSNRGRHFGDLQAAHHWSWIIPSSDLTTGKHQATIRVEEPGRPRQKFTHRFTS